MAHPKEVAGFKLGKLLIEGKTKQVFDLPEETGHCILINKDRITAGDGVKAHDMEGKAAISNQTNAKVFEILKAAGIPTAFVKIASPVAFISKKCDMVPIEWVTRRLATGSFLKRNPGVPEGYRFTPPKQETFFKDDANHDPQWSEEQIVSAKFTFNGLVIGQDEVDYMRNVTILVFEILEKAWGLRDCALIDMKIEFGVDADGKILLADVIDSDSWRLWPSGDKRLMVDKQVYRNLSTVTAADLDTVKRNFAWVKDQLDHLRPKVHHKVVIIMGSAADVEHCQKIAKAAKKFGLDVDMRVTSAHKATEETLHIMKQYEDTHGALVFIAVAGRSNGLGPVLSGNTSYPVINCPPPSSNLVQDIWSSLSLPSGLGCATVIYPDSAAVMAAQIIGVQDYIVWARIRFNQLEMAASLRVADKKVRNLSIE
ncbi:bifunctional phosphoribosylaminoimidazole carboxylase/phosphoribosylaminoimidazole succinocarboxamide synthetase [Leptidea sinapis]|uniref:bifunctional phosphoribosylaminoimidazole carboxylase/phosphoribosylaminoimidazole succinocarboxamide synthetase n=1 Tax=Leptidea sinapis TaxID=189913 RepID=UPI002123EBC0|nr:bifunctional phosphoribosylaminoimidazole carboxylase/phosphoribosylaminoimidazole succinocarboxamide synthetase [Leptidea sinapis]